MGVDRRNLPGPLQSFAGLVPALAPRLDAIERRSRAFAALLGSGQVLANTLDAMRVELTYHSNAIEGNTLSLRETQLVIEGTVPPSGTTSRALREIYEARNHDRAIRLVEQWIAKASHSWIATEGDLLAVHAEVLRDIDPANAGRYRSGRVFIAGTRFVPPSNEKFPVLIPPLLAAANDAGVPAALRAAELHYNLVAVHPFADGNGRTSRLMMNAVLLASGCPLTVIEVERRAEYLSALDQANQGDLLPFASVVLDAVERSLSRLGA